MLLVVSVPTEARCLLRGTTCRPRSHPALLHPGPPVKLGYRTLDPQSSWASEYYGKSWTHGQAVLQDIRSHTSTPFVRSQSERHKANVGKCRPVRSHQAPQSSWATGGSIQVPQSSWASGDRLDPRPTRTPSQAGLLVDRAAVRLDPRPTRTPSQAGLLVDRAAVRLVPRRSVLQPKQGSAHCRPTTSQQALASQGCRRTASAERVLLYNTLFSLFLSHTRI